MIMGENGTLNLARFPNMYEDGSDQLIQAARTESPDSIRVYMPLFNKRVAKYHDVSELILYGYLVWGWYKDLIITDGYTVDEETGDFIYHVPHPEETYLGVGLRYDPEFINGFSYDYDQMAVLNVSEELDAPGEYWIDAEAGEFYVYDPAGEYHFNAGESAMLTLGKAEYITLLGLDFRNSTDSFIKANDHPRGFTLDRCSFVGNSAMNMIEITATDRGRALDLLVTRCSFSTCAGRAIYIYTVNK
jgi:hypothetical protein